MKAKVTIKQKVGRKTIVDESITKQAEYAAETPLEEVLALNNLPD